jgi:hypothetical protein
MNLAEAWPVISKIPGTCRRYPLRDRIVDSHLASSVALLFLTEYDLGVQMSGPRIPERKNISQ